MINKIVLIIAILAGIGAVCVDHFKVAPYIADTEDQLHKTTDDLTAEKSAKEKVQRDLKKTQDDLDKTSNELTKTKSDLQSTTARAEAAEKTVDEKTVALTKAMDDIEKAKSEAKEYFAIGKTPEEIKKAYVSLKKTTEERDIYIQEKKILQVTINRLENKIIELKGPSQVVELPKDLKGKIIAVDPKYDFVILNVGGEQGVKQYGEMLINRDGQLISKVRIVRVEPDHSVANIVAGWSKGDVLEGDTATVY